MDWLTVKYDVIVLEVLPLLVPFWILVENDSHCLSAGQPSAETLSAMESNTAATKRRSIFMEDRLFGTKGYSLVGLKHSGAAVGSSGGEIASFSQLRRSSVRAGIIRIDLFLHGLHTLQTCPTVSHSHTQWQIQNKANFVLSRPARVPWRRWFCQTFLLLWREIQQSASLSLLPPQRLPWSSSQYRCDWPPQAPTKHLQTQRLI